MTYKYFFTVFTPTFNREHTLPTVYATLRAQTFMDFEWLVVDDGSSDKTYELIKNLMKVSPFPIRYYWQKNAGKHVARNFAVSQALGKLFFTLDSDDEITSNALERFVKHWIRIPSDKRERFAGVAGLCARQDGSIVGNKFPSDIFDSNMFEIRNKYRVKGDKCGFQRTDIMREFPFPEIESERFITEAIVWNRIALAYKTRFVNEIYKKVNYLPNGLSASHLKLRVQNPKGFELYFNECLCLHDSLRGKLKCSINYVRCCLHRNKNIIEIIAKAKSPYFVFACIPFGILLYFKDRREYLRTK